MAVQLICICYPYAIINLNKAANLISLWFFFETTLSITPVTFITDSLVYVPSCSPISHLSPLYHVIAFFAAPYCKIVTIPSVFRKKNLMMIYTIHANQRARLSGY